MKTLKLWKPAFVLVGEFLTRKYYKLQCYAECYCISVASLEGMEIHDLRGFRYSSMFYHKLDLEKVIDRGPWSFEQAILVFHHMKENEEPHLVALKEAEMLVQVYDIPRGLLSKNILKSVGESIGRYAKSDLANFDGTWKSYVRVKVVLNIEK